MYAWARASIVMASTLIATTTIDGADRPVGYLAPGELDMTHILEPAPQRGDPRYETDRKIFRATRRLVDTPRWQLATSDAEINTLALLRAFSCAAGAKLTPENVPKVVHVLLRATADTGAQTNLAKEFFKRGRPYTIDSGRICQPQAELYDAKAHRVSYDYPSGHTTRGWTYALVLAALAPDRAQQILERGRAYGDSRFICGAHNESAVEAGFVSASATMALVATKPAYQADLAEARAELMLLRKTDVLSSRCEDEAALLRQRVMPKLNAP